MVDGQGQQAATVGLRPVGGEAQQGDGVAASGEGQGERMVDMGFQPRGQAGPDGAGPVGEIWRQPGLRAGGAAGGAAGQPMRVRASVALVRRAGLAVSA